jgi:hypothetical protein
MARDSGFLPIKPSVILITGRLDPAATLLLREILDVVGRLGLWTIGMPLG